MNQILALSGCSDYPIALKGENQYLSWQWLGEGIVNIEPQTQPIESQVLISTGIHGNETAPIEIVSRIVSQLLNGEFPLAVSLLVVFGNVQAIAQGKRYLDVDLNRLFDRRHEHYRDALETQRAITIEEHVLGFFSSNSQSVQRFHFDLHTAIRGSYHQKFGLLPQRLKAQQCSYLNWLTAMGLQALVINLIPSGTFSSFTSNRCDATSCTLELGKAKPFGSNELASFSEIKNALIKMLAGNEIPATKAIEPVVYKVEKELTKITEQFKFIAVDEQVENFTRYPSGTVIATDGRVIYQVRDEFEWILFPNPLVNKGLRAGMLLVQVGIENLFIDNTR